MNNILWKEFYNAVRESEEAFKNYHQLLEDYFPAIITPGAPIPSGKPLTEAAYREIIEAEAKFKEACQKEEDTLRRLQLEGQSP